MVDSLSRTKTVVDRDTVFFQCREAVVKKNIRYRKIWKSKKVDPDFQEFKNAKGIKQKAKVVVSHIERDGKKVAEENRENHKKMLEEKRKEMRRTIDNK